MSRSRKKNQYTAWVRGFSSNKTDKQRNQRMLRRAAHIMLHSASDLEAIILPYKLEEFMDRWDYSDDGRVYRYSHAARRWGLDKEDSYYRK